jgi:hypothetical protein
MHTMPLCLASIPAPALSTPSMPTFHKNKTLATLLAFLFGAVGVHRFYLRGFGDKFGWLHAASLPVSGILLQAFPEQQWLFSASPLVLSLLAAFLETLVIGLTPDDKWDQLHNLGSGRTNRSSWPLAVLLVMTLGVGATTLIAVIARSFDLLFTGGTFG